MKAVSLLAITALVFPIVLFAGADNDRKSEFKAMDRNQDGYVTIIEAEGKLDLLRQWADVDGNSDGKLEMSEFSAFEIAPAYVQDDPEDEATIGAAPH